MSDGECCCINCFTDSYTDGYTSSDSDDEIAIQIRKPISYIGKDKDEKKEKIEVKKPKDNLNYSSENKTNQNIIITNL